VTVSASAICAEIVARQATAGIIVREPRVAK
jgi:hypothetical protein